MSLKKKALSGVFWASLEHFGIQIVTFSVSIVLARVLLPEEFGLIAMLGIFIGLGSVLINSGLSYSLIRTENPDEEDFSTVFFFNLTGSIFIYLCIYLLAPLISDFYNQDILTPIIRVYSITFFINAFSTVQTTRLTKYMDFKTQSRITIPALIVGSFCGILMAYSGFGVWSLVWSSISQSLAAVIFLWFWTKWKPLWVFNIKKFKYHFNYGIKLMFSGIIEVIFTNSYSIIIGKFFPPAQVGFYNRADSLQMFPVRSIGTVITKVSFPLFSSIQNDDLRLKIIYKKIMKLVIFIVAPTLVFMSVLGEPLFRFLFTEKWLPAVPYFQILCANGILYPLHSYNLQILNVKGRSDLFLKLEILKKIMAAIVIFISFSYGIYGLLYGSVILSILSFFINTHYSGKFLNYSAWEQTLDILPSIIFSIIIGYGLYIFDNVLESYLLTDISRLFIGALSGVTLYLIISYIFKISSLSELMKIIKGI